jgi:hypothetical protein
MEWQMITLIDVYATGEICDGQRFVGIGGRAGSKAEIAGGNVVVTTPDPRHGSSNTVYPIDSIYPHIMAEFILVRGRC